MLRSPSLSAADSIAQLQASRLERYKAARDAAKKRLQTMVGRLAMLLVFSGIFILWSKPVVAGLPLKFVGVVLVNVGIITGTTTDVVADQVARENKIVVTGLFVLLLLLAVMDAQGSGTPVALMRGLPTAYYLLRFKYVHRENNRVRITDIVCTFQALATALE